MKNHRPAFISRLALGAGLALLVGIGAGPAQAAPATSAKEKAKTAAKPAPRTKPVAVASPAPRPETKAAKNVPLPRARPTTGATAALAPAGQSPAVRPSAGPVALPPAEVAVPPAPAAGIVSSPISSRDLDLVKDAMRLIDKGKIDAAHSLTRDMKDPTAQKVVEWAILRSYHTADVPFERFIAFIKQNPDWPSIDLFRRRAEGALWEDRRDTKTVTAYFANETPLSSKGRLVLARALLAQGNPKAAEHLVRQVWRQDGLTLTLEIMVTNTFGDMLTRADHKARMDSRLYDEDFSAATRMAQLLGSAQLAIVKAYAAVKRGASNAKALLDAVPAEVRNEPSYIFARVYWLRRADKIAEAGKLMLTAPNDPAVLHDLDQWWVERRYVIRNLLDTGDAKTAYRIARDAAAPPKENYFVDHHFMAGWIALRFLQDPATALTHFARIAPGLSNPHALTRANYWQGRALEALGRHEEARKNYEAAAQHSAVYYGQIARGKLGLPDLTLQPPPRLPASRQEVARAAEILYAIDERRLVSIMMADLGERSDNAELLAAMGDAAARYADGHGMVLLGKGALGRGLPFDYYAYPTVGLPAYKPIGPPVEPAITYSIARTESHFNQKVVSHAKAMGLMQVTPAAGRDTAKRFKVTYDEKKLRTDPVYNMQIGAGELAILIQGYRGSYILTFAGYNAGRGRVKEWIARFGDPRDPKIDPIDWIERIPIAETRNYVQRIMENLQVYRVRFGGGNRLLIEADLRRGAGIRAN
ncbi:MAG: transglycosylase SLT domain-containing protein [Xanthobacteraceae bacterium]